ncbi:hypothetical protein T4C_1824 [Trichinella pseudospiralis]|uniref:Integrase catalytic domain-containing protein n=1 Tax=Trichinella pseudospiralis TaxID=6337 RepID=A0A0V1IQ80_TRIPS|nr:hypothetical protein T4C_1824 [Trichinella pseudospiralis]
MDGREFWDQFEVSVHQQVDLSNATKLVYLRGCLTGVALDALQGLSAANQGYEIAVQRLKERCNRPHVAVCHNGVLSLSALGKDPRDRSLSMGEVLIAVARERLPPSIRIQWDKRAMEDDSLAANLPVFLRFLQDQVELDDTTQGCHRAGTRKGNLGNFETTVLDAERRNRSEEGDTKLFCLPVCNGETEPAENGGLAIQRSRSFRIHWMDFAGPLLVRVRRKATSKCYVCLFTCMASRAVPQMTSAKVMEALRRFIARQGRPEIIQSDNFRSFKAAASELRQLWRHVDVERVQHRIQWNFIPERAPWMGGYWERLVRSIKESSLPQRQTTDIRGRRESRTPPVVAVPVADRLHVRRLPSCRSSRPGMAAIWMWSTAMKPPMAVPSADDDLPVDVECQWRIWKSELDDLPSIALPRAYFPSSPVETSRLGLHGFGDASKAAYSAVVYLKAVKSPENVSVSFVTAKSKVAPLKKLSIPRLELMAALLCARLVCYVRKELPLNVEACHCWSDSLVALGCIRGEACRWKPFMANRVRKIQPGELRMQHHHPCSLCNQVAWTVLVTGSPIGLVDARRPKHPRRRGGSRARMTFYGCRYDDHSSPGRNIHLRSRKEISPFLDEFGILRVGGLPGRANLDGRTKHLILLPHRDWLIELLIRREHLRGCTICRRVTAPPFQQRMSELPEMRVEPVGLFVNVGVDFAGPLLIRSDGPNRLTQKATFIARHGRPVIMQSDNFQTSRKAGRFLQSVFDALNWEAVQRHLDTERARWQFITERAFWCGGYWERMVRSVKAALRKAVGRRMLNFDELRTVLCEVEARINDRPPTLVFDEPQE